MDLRNADKQSGLPGPIAGWGSGVMDTDTTATQSDPNPNPNLSREQFGDGPLGSYSQPSTPGLGVYNVGVDTGTV